MAQWAFADRRAAGTMAFQIFFDSVQHFPNTSRWKTSANTVKDAFHPDRTLLGNHEMGGRSVMRLAGTSSRHRSRILGRSRAIMDGPSCHDSDGLQGECFQPGYWVQKLSDDNMTASHDVSPHFLRSEGISNPKRFQRILVYSRAQPRRCSSDRSFPRTKVALI
jgi:hypothetical protein